MSNNILILGSGRSGTSMVAGLFRNSGLYMGDILLKPTQSNPLGYYEDRKMNELNGKLVQVLLNWPLLNRVRLKFCPPAHREINAYWIAAPIWIRPWVRLSPSLIESMKAFISKQPFCYKDPRFNITLPLWRKFLPANTHCIVVFREPFKVVDSCLRDFREVATSINFITAEWCLLAWVRSYRRILAQYSNKGKWFFVHDEDVLNGKALPALENFCGVKLDTTQIRPELRRAVTSESSGRNFGGRYRKQAMKVYSDLLARSRQDMGCWDRARVA